MDEFVDVTVKATGALQRVPRIWLDDPILGRHFERTATQRALDGEPEARPDKSWTGAHLKEFAASLGVDLTGVDRKADMLAAVTNVLDDVAPVAATASTVEETPTSPDANQAADETPANGDKEN